MLKNEPGFNFGFNALVTCSHCSAKTKTLYAGKKIVGGDCDTLFKCEYCGGNLPYNKMMMELMAQSFNKDLERFLR